MSAGPIIYDPVTDTMLVELRAWAWEIEHASRHPDRVSRALRALRAERGLPDAA